MGEDQNGFKSSRHGIQPDNSIHYRIKALEDDVCDLEKYSDELRLGQNTREIQILELKNVVDRLDREIEIMKTAAALSTKEINDKIESLRMTINSRIDKVEKTLGDKFDENKNYFSRWFIGIIVSLLVSVTVGIAAFILNR